MLLTASRTLNDRVTANAPTRSDHQLDSSDDEHLGEGLAATSSSSDNKPKAPQADPPFATGPKRECPPRIGGSNQTGIALIS